MSKSHTQMLLAVAVLVILYLWWKRTAVVKSTLTIATPSTVAGPTASQTAALLSELDQNAPSN